ncbi:hypothetical protein [Mesorhizobium captivum]|uniref:hypothetical protein n=1 Tax=Mesorhizobium captivum TaxID=3072319 RepID=UPI002A24670B|nr:hypothetical protein [Mesorhizobium sp. VK23E]MDX8513595.1 hypothetical protein [Mesorhizobium sp. VK23E]
MTLQPFDNKAHEIIATILDDAAERLVREKICQARQADEYLTLAYIGACSSIIEHATAYLQVDETIGAGVFLERYSVGKNRQAFHHNDTRCSKQLATHPNVYFPDYLTILRLASLNTLNTISDVRSLRANGTLMLAAASLPGVATDIRRELRRRGLSFDPSLVPDDVMQKRIGPRGTLAIAHRIAGPKSERSR